MHAGRAWTGHTIEDACTCPQAPCGLVPLDQAAPDCLEHAFTAGKTLRQGHTPARCPGTDREEPPMTDLPTPPLPPLTAEDFVAPGFTYRGVPVVEPEDGDCVFTHGHVDADLFVAAVHDYDSEFADPGAAEAHNPDDVEHWWAVTIEPAPEWRIRWGGITADTPGAFPVTVVER
jgi:hypothetical protein